MFEDYIAPAAQTWQRRVTERDDALLDLSAGRTPHRRLIGLPTLLGDGQFDDLLREFVHAAIDQALQCKPGSGVFIEKSPSNTLRVDLIARLCPGAAYIHVVRHPYDVVRSLLSVSSEWGTGWAPTSAEVAAHMWADHVAGGRRASDLAPDRYLEVRYEDLAGTSGDRFAPVLRFLGSCFALDLEAAHSTSVGASVDDLVYGSNVRERLAGHPVRDPADFRGTRAPLTGPQRRIVDAIAGDTMLSCGYAVTTNDDGSGLARRVARRVRRAFN